MFSAFPSGWPGLGLLLLRAEIGVTLVVQGSAYLVDWHELGWVTRAVGILSVASGVSLLIGYLTPFVGALAALISLGTTLSWFQAPAPNLLDTKVATAMAASVAVAIICLGPGAFSIDARVFGRREIIIPGPSRPREH